MDTVQLQCGSCKNLMAIAAEHMGGQVRCPHCQAVVQTPPRNPEPAPAAPSTMAPAELDMRDSIFAGTEASESVLGDPPRPQAEMPVAPFANQPAEATTPASDAEFTPIKPRPVYSSGTLPIIALIFLVPYALVMTAFVLYLVMSQSRHDPYEFLRDPVPNPKSGGAKTVTIKTLVHTRALAANLKTTIGKPLRIGDLLVTPEKVRMTADGDMQLILRAKNVSANTAFEPMHDKFVNGHPPYTYLESRSKDGGKVFGALLEYHKEADAQDEPRGDAILNPKQETFIVLETPQEARDKFITKIARSKDNFTWRVQVRRGFVKVDGTNYSATAVIGVDFNAKEIEPAKKS